MQFSSKPPFNDDPKPYVTYADERKTDVRNADWDIQSDGATEYVRVFKPRPEFERPQHNPTNPILTEFRNLHEATGNDLWTDAYLSWSDLLEEEQGTQGEYFHALEVLGRIVTVTNPMNEDTAETHFNEHERKVPELHSLVSYGIVRVVRSKIWYLVLRGSVVVSTHWTKRAALRAAGDVR